MRLNIGSLKTVHFVEYRALVGYQRFPIGNGFVPIRAFGGERAVFHVINRDAVHGNHAAACARFNRHVAQRHAAFHAQASDGFAAELNRIARAACCANLSNNIQRNVFGGYARFQAA